MQMSNVVFLILVVCVAATSLFLFQLAVLKELKNLDKRLRKLEQSEDKGNVDYGTRHAFYSRPEI